jgi:hypothetical protein
MRRISQTVKSTQRLQRERPFVDLAFAIVASAWRFIRAPHARAAIIATFVACERIAAAAAIRVAVNECDRSFRRKETNRLAKRLVFPAQRIMHHVALSLPRWGSVHFAYTVERFD